MKLKKSYLLLLFVAALFTSCSDDDDNGAPLVEPTGSLVVDDQMYQDGMLMVSSITMSNDGWLVIHADADGAPVVPEIISEPVYLEAGTHTDVEVMIEESATIEDGDVLWAMLHTDDGELGEYEFNGQNGFDAPILDDMGNIVMDSFVVSVMPAPTGSLTVEDQALAENMISVNSITLDHAGYVVVHADNGENAPQVPEIISEPVYLEAGTYSDVDIMLTESANVQEGDVLWVMLHTDNGTEEVYEFDGQNGLDGPILDENGNIVMASLEITDVPGDEPMGSLEVEDQVLTMGTVEVGSIMLDEDGWVVIHAASGDGPVVPEIISVPVYLEAGEYTDVEVPLKEGADVMAGESVWVMLHNDSGTEGQYEFDGQNGLDLPIKDAEGNIVMKSVMITSVSVEAITGSITVSDQAVSDNMITVSSITLDESGYVVIHADNGEGGPVVPDIISEPVYLEAGTHTDVQIALKESADVEVGDTLWLMLHNDTGVEGMYEFNGQNGLDMPLLTATGEIVMTSIVITE